MDKILTTLALLITASICASANALQLASVNEMSPGEAAQANIIPPGPPLPPKPEAIINPAAVPAPASPVICTWVANSDKTLCVHAPAPAP
jgi:hypothetical protein